MKRTNSRRDGRPTMSGTGPGQTTTPAATAEVELPRSEPDAPDANAAGVTAAGSNTSGADAESRAKGPRLLWGVDAAAVTTLCSMRIEISSRLLRSTGPASRRAGTYPPADDLTGITPFTGHDAVADAALVHRLTAVTPEVGLELPADRVDDAADLIGHAADAGIRIGTVWPDVSGRPGRPLPLCHPDPDIADRAQTALCRSATRAADLRARRFGLRLRDGAVYPGGAEVIRRQQRLASVLAQLRDQLPAEIGLVVEYGLADPAPARRARPDWHLAHALATAAGPNTKVLLDLTDPTATPDEDPELSITTLRSADRLAGIELGGGPFALFLALIEATEGGLLVRGRRCPVPFAVELPAGEQPGVEATLHAVAAVQDAAAKALLLDRPAWRAARLAGDVAGATDVLLTAYETDARPLLTAVRAALGVPADTQTSYRELCRDTHRVVERQRSVLRAALRRGAVGQDARSVDRLSAGPVGSQVVATGRWPVRAGGLRGVG